MLEKYTIAIKSTQRVADNALSIEFDSPWMMDDLSPFIDHVINVCGITTVNEVILGADLHCVRFTYEEDVFLLQFEEYSQSSWIETETPEGEVHLMTLESLLVQQ